VRVKNAVEAVESIQKAEVNLQNKQIVVEYDKGEGKSRKIKATVQEAGYEPL